MIIDIRELLKSTSPLVSDTILDKYSTCQDLSSGIEKTFIPARNILFLTIAANRATYLEIRDLYIGVCETDFAGYWDCRDSFIKSMEKALGEGIYGSKSAIKIHTPLMFLTKSESVFLAKDVMGNDFEQIMELTHTCYDGIKGGCGQCHACLLRDRGFQESNINDPIWKFRNKFKSNLTN